MSLQTSTLCQTLSSTLCQTLSKALEMPKETPVTSIGELRPNDFVFHVLYLRILKCKNHLEENQTEKL